LGGTTGGNNSSSVDSQQQILDLNEIPGLIMVGSGSTLLLNNLFLNNVAYKSSYVRTDYQPYRTEGAGTGLWPSIQFAPNSTVSGDGVLGWVPDGSAQFSRTLRTGCRSME
jgi:hypothetical protein